MISISTITYDLDGSRVFLNDSKTDLSEISRRSTRTATLDGGVSVYDSGFCEGDRTFEIIIDNPTQEDADFCSYIVKTYSSVVVSCNEGVFLGNPSNFRRTTGGDLKLTLKITEKIS